MCFAPATFVAAGARRSHIVLVDSLRPHHSQVRSTQQEYVSISRVLSLRCDDADLRNVVHHYGVSVFKYLSHSSTKLTVVAGVYIVGVLSSEGTRRYGGMGNCYDMQSYLTYLVAVILIMRTVAIWGYDRTIGAAFVVAVSEILVSRRQSLRICHSEACTDQPGLFLGL